MMHPEKPSWKLWVILFLMEVVSHLAANEMKFAWVKLSQKLFSFCGRAMQAASVHHG